MINFIKNLFGPKADLKSIFQNGAMIIDVRTPKNSKRDTLKDP